MQRPQFPFPHPQKRALTCPARKEHAHEHAANPPARKRITLLALCLAAFIISLDVTIVNVALPTLARPDSASARRQGRHPPARPP